jgi:hypothetical protein
MSAREHAIDSAATVIADGLALRDSLPPRQAAEMAWTPTGPTIDELERMIRTSRGQATRIPVAANAVLGCAA